MDYCVGAFTAHGFFHLQHFRSNRASSRSEISPLWLRPWSRSRFLRNVTVGRFGIPPRSWDGPWSLVLEVNGWLFHPNGCVYIYMYVCMYCIYIYTCRLISSRKQVKLNQLSDLTIVYHHETCAGQPIRRQKIWSARGFNSHIVREWGRNGPSKPFKTHRSFRLHAPIPSFWWMIPGVGEDVSDSGKPTNKYQQTIIEQTDLDSHWCWIGSIEPKWATKKPSYCPL